MMGVRDTFLAGLPGRSCHPHIKLKVDLLSSRIPGGSNSVIATRKYLCSVLRTWSS